VIAEMNGDAIVNLQVSPDADAVTLSGALMMFLVVPNFVTAIVERDVVKVAAGP
jgi:hypothetical protein